MNRCAGFKRDGARCTATVEPPQAYCWWHDPANLEERRRAASKGGRGRATREVKTLKARIQTLMDGVESGDIDPTQGNTILRGYSVLLDYIKLEREVHVTEDLAARIEELKNAQHRKTS
jgi:hypothetical protein